MWTSAQVNQVATFVGGNLSSFRDLVRDELHFEWVIAEELNCFFFCKDYSLERLLFAGYLLGCFLNHLIMVLVEYLKA